MFGSNDKDEAKNNDVVSGGDTGVTTTPTEPAADATLDNDSSDSDNPPTDNTVVSSAPEVTAPSPSIGDPTPPAGTPMVSSNDTQAKDAAAPDSPKLSSPHDVDKNGLLELKQNALEQLSPLVEHLDQTPEEKFRTLMMMIQAADNHRLVNDAFAAAKQIPDDKTRAQALLDVVNEINYFTQKSDS